MVENSVGRIWIEHLRAIHPDTDEKAAAESFGWKYYLPEAEQEEAVNVKLAEIRTTYKDLKPTDITCIDPCMGSGHILIAMFDVLMDIYESAGYDKREAAFEIVENNIHGLDIDQRAYQLSYFAVMMKGRGYNRRFLRDRDRKPEPKVYAIEESNDIDRSHLNFFGNHLSEKERSLVMTQMEGVLDTFIDAKEYGSILNVEAYDWDLLERFVEDYESERQIGFDDMGSDKTQDNLRRLIKVAKNLGQKYDAVVTNPPYMGLKSGMSEKLAKKVKKNYFDSKNDLYAVFIQKSLQMTKSAGFIGMITQHSWMFQASFEKIRKTILQYNICNLLHLGARAFDEIGGEVVQTCSFTISKVVNKEYGGTYIKLGDGINEFDKKKIFFSKKNRYVANIKQFQQMDEEIISYWLSNSYYKLFQNSHVDKYGYTFQGIITGNTEKYLKLWFELKFDSIKFNENDIYQLENNNVYFPYIKGGGFRRWYGNLEYVIHWVKNGMDYVRSRTENRNYFFRTGLTWSDLCTGKFSCRNVESGFLFDASGPMIYPNTKDNIWLMCGYFNSKVFQSLLNINSQGLHYGNGSIARQPFIANIDDTLKITTTNYVKDNIEIARRDWDSFETSWGFQQHPLFCKVNTISESFVQWWDECNMRFNQLKANEEELNRIFIDMYGLREELTPEVEDKDITVRKADLQRDIRSFVSYAVGCMFGRYSLDEEGLIYAGGEWDSSRYKTFIPDEDNCIPITDEEYFSDDIVGRFVESVKIVYGADTLEENLDFIAKALGNKGDTSREVIRNYFLKDFYADHLKVYQKRPIYWLFDSGKENGFKALIYMHRYDADTVGRVRTDYLHRAQKYVETAMQRAQYTIDNASSASEKSKARKAVTKYTKQLAEMKIYDEAISHIANKRIEIDLDDGVKVNYAKFQGVEVAQEGKKTLKVDILAKIK